MHWRDLSTSVIHNCGTTWVYCRLDSGASYDVSVEGEVTVENEVGEFFYQVSKNNRGIVEDLLNLENKTF